MKNIIIFLFIFVLMANILANEGKKAISVNTISHQKTEISFTLPAYQIEKIYHDETEYDQIILDETPFTASTGMPELPIFSAAITVPVNSEIRISDIYQSKGVITSDIFIYPCQNPLDPDYTFDINYGFYTSKDENLVYPAENYEISGVETFRDYQFITLQIFPFRFYPNNKYLEITEEISFTIYHESPNMSSHYNLRPQISKVFEPLYENLFDNYSQIRLPNPIYQEPTLLIIYGQLAGIDPNSKALLDQLITWKRQRGIRVVAAPASNDVGGAGTTNAAIKSFINAHLASPNPPDWILLIGAPGTPSSNNYFVPAYHNSTIEGVFYTDYEYTQGPEIRVLAYTSIGRLVIDSHNSLNSYVQKILQYEKAPFLGGYDWLSNSLLVSVSNYSGISTFINNRYIKSLISDYDPNHNFREMFVYNTTGASIASLWNQGNVQFSIRDRVGLVGFPDQVSNLSNDKQLTNCVAITCHTAPMRENCFSSNITRTIRASGALVGAINAAGMGAHSHVAYNNVHQGGVFYGLYHADMPSMGQALLFAKINLYKSYNNVVTGTDGQMRWHIRTLNLIGDLSVNIYKTTPKTFITELPNTIPTGTQGIRLELIDNENQPVKDANVTITQVEDFEITYLSKGISEENGLVYIGLDPELTGNIIITLSKANFAPKIQMITTNIGASVMVKDFLVHDYFPGNENGEINPGETISLSIQVENYFDEDVYDLTATLISDSDQINIIENTVQLGSIEAGEIETYPEAFTFSVSSVYEDKTLLPLIIEITDGIDTWHSYLTLEVKGLKIVVAGMTPETISTNNPTSVYFSLKNNGSMIGENLNAELSSSDPILSISQQEVFIGSIQPGQTINNIGPFVVNVIDIVYPGMLLVAELNLFNNQGYEESLLLKIQAGVRLPSDPTGPDDYGYMMIGSNDTAYFPEDPEAIVTPVYNWKSIRTIGVNTNINDTSASGEEGGAVISLPFTASYYGIDYEEIFICSNGWFVFGTTEQKDFRNLPLPGPVAPKSIVSPYWTDLVVGGQYGGGIYTYHDEEDNAFIIQWDRLRYVQNYTTSGFSVAADSVTFQAIIYDPAFHHTETGDSPIKMQYHKWLPGHSGSNSSPFNYVTVGLQDHTSERGLTYVYDNIYTPGSVTITNGFAILIADLYLMAVTPPPEGPFLKVVPENINYGSLVMGAPALDKTITISSIGTEPATLQDIELIGDIEDFTLLGIPELPLILEPLEQITLTLNYLPTTEGVKNTLLNVIDEQETNTVNIISLVIDYSIRIFPHLQNFDDVTPPNLPPDWVAYIEPGTLGAVTTSNIQPRSQPNNLRIYPDYNIDSIQMLISPFVEDITSKKIGFYTRTSPGPQPILIGTVTDRNDPDTWQQLASFTISNTTYNAIQIIVPLMEATGDYIAIRRENDSNSMLFIDDVEIDFMPNGAYFWCSIPNIDFGSFPINIPSTATALYHNIGNEGLIIEHHFLPEGITANPPGSISIPPNNTVEIIYTFSPIDTGIISGDIVLTTNAANAPTYNIPYTAIVLERILYPPTNLTAVAGNNDITLSWDPPEDGNSYSPSVGNGFIRSASGNGATSNSRLFVPEAERINAFPTGRTLTNYNIYKNGELLHTTDTDELNYIDSEVVNNIPYTYYVTALYSSGESDPSNEITIEPIGRILHPPANLRYTIQGSENVLLEWNFGEYIINENFEAISLNPSWLNIDNDTDGYCWEISIDDQAEYYQSIISRSAINSTLLTPDNWLISEEFMPVENTYLNYWISANNTILFAESYDLRISTSGDNIEDFEELLFSETLGFPGWQRRSINLSSFAEETTRIAFVHNTIIGQDALKLDGVGVIKPVEYPPEGLINFTIFRNNEALHITNGLEFSYLDTITINENYTYYVIANYGTGSSFPGNIIAMQIVSQIEEIINYPTELKGNYPNPFNPETTIYFSLSHEANIHITIYNIKGQKVLTLIDEVTKPGEHKVVWNGTDNNKKAVSSGIYFYKMETEGYVGVKKMILLK